LMTHNWLLTEFGAGEAYASCPMRRSKLAG
jgi:hypothetical protein